MHEDHVEEIQVELLQGKKLDFREAAEDVFDLRGRVETQGKFLLEQIHNIERIQLAFVRLEEVREKLDVTQFIRNGTEVIDENRNELDFFTPH